MAITDLKNISDINTRVDTKGQLVESKDLNIFKSSAAVINQFGQSKNDVIEFRLYDKSNNLLTQTNNKKVRYIKSTEFNEYLNSSVDQNGEKIYSINVEKLITDSGNGEGEYRVSLNFVKNKLGTDNEYEKVWIEEISPSRKEIRVLPLLKDGSAYNSTITKRYTGFQQNYTELRSSTQKLLNKIDSIELQVSFLIDEYFSSKYGVTYVDNIKKNFGLATSWVYLKEQILKDFKQSITNQINGRDYKLGSPLYGQTSFEKMDLDEFEEFTPYIVARLRDSIEYNMRNVNPVKFTPSVQNEINNSPEVAILESLIEKPYISNSNIGADSAPKKEVNGQLSELIRQKELPTPKTKEVWNDVTKKYDTIPTTGPEEVLSKVNDVKQYSTNQNEATQQGVSPTRQSITDTISNVKGQVDDVKAKITGTIDKANELKQKGAEALSAAQGAVDKIAGLKGELTGKVDALKGQADAAIGNAKGAVDKVKGLLKKKPKKMIGASKFKTPKLF